jgi:allantoin racemase
MRVLRVIAEERGKYDGILLACFGDPGLYAIKEFARVPTIGIAEASLSTALLLGQSFSILVAQKKAVSMMENMVMNYGLDKRLASVEPLETPVLDLAKGREQTIEKMINVGREAIGKGAEVLILGCAGMTGFSTILEKELGVTVVDPIATGYKVLESLVELNLNVSRCGIYAPPEQKKILGAQVLKLGVV